MNKTFSIGHVFNNHMMIPREEEVSIWGKAESGTKVILDFVGISKATEATNGEWLIKIPALKDGGPYEMKIMNNEDSIILKDILVGELWE